MLDYFCPLEGRKQIGKYCNSQVLLVQQVSVWDFETVLHFLSCGLWLCTHRSRGIVQDSHTRTDACKQRWMEGDGGLFIINEGQCVHSPVLQLRVPLNAINMKILNQQTLWGGRRLRVASSLTSSQLCLFLCSFCFLRLLPLLFLSPY